MTTRQFEALEVSIDDLIISPLNVRQDIDDVSELADSIREQGVLEPLVVRRTADGKFEVIIGSRRLTASRQVGLNLIPVVVQDISDTEAVQRSLAENIQRQNLSLEERVGAYQTLRHLEPERFGSSRGLARAIGRGRSNIDNDFAAYEALTRLRPRGVSVRQNTSPQSSNRKSGDVIPTAHAAMIQQAMSAVGGMLPSESSDDTYEELARAVAPLEQDRARRVLDYFKMYPDRPIPEIVSMALATVQRQVTLPAETARKLEDLATSGGASDWDTILAGLVEERSGGTPLLPSSDIDDAVSEASQHTSELNVDGDEGIQAMLEPDETMGDGDDELPSLSQPESGIQPGALPTDSIDPTPSDVPTGRTRMPEAPMSEQWTNKRLWNIRHSRIEANFYTIGYGQSTLDQFMDILQQAGISILIDIRDNPHSQYKPDFNKSRLREELMKSDIEYIHREDLGVPSSIRALSHGQPDRAKIWKWYDENIISRLYADPVNSILKDAKNKAAFMCVEFDPTACHRHRLFIELEAQGNMGYDL